MDGVPWRTRMEARFGSDEALGVYFVLDEDGSTLTLKEFEQMRQAMPIDDMPGMESRLPGGGSGTYCTDYAELIYNALPGREQYRKTILK